MGEHVKLQKSLNQGKKGEFMGSLWEMMSSSVWLVLEIYSSVGQWDLPRWHFTDQTNFCINYNKKKKFKYCVISELKRKTEETLDTRNEERGKKIKKKARAIEEHWWFFSSLWMFQAICEFWVVEAETLKSTWGCWQDSLHKSSDAIPSPI